jgi:tetratricopeptide (TPR) repeat protein
MATENTSYEIFISYSRQDNQLPVDAPPNAKAWVTALRDHILADHRCFSTEPLRIFFDTDEILDMDDWQHRILAALRSSKILLVCLSPNYFANSYRRWEWEEYVKRQVHALMGSESIATVYFVEVPGSDEQRNARWLEDIMRGNFTDIRPWFPEGAEALQREEVRRRMAALGQSLWERLQRARRAEAAPGNLRRQNPHFVGRREELRHLHEQLGTGAMGVVTAVHGLGGQGKTELAVAYAHGWADYYHAGLWTLGAEGKKELLPLIGELAWDRQLGFAPSEAARNDPVLLGRGVFAHLQQRAEAVNDRDPDKGAAALLLLDNVSDSALLSPAQLATLPRADWLRIVATTRLGPETLRAHQHQLALLAVDSLDEDSALALLRDHQPPRDAQGNIVADLAVGVPGFAARVEEDAAREIVRALGGFTLAIEQVAVFLGLHPEIAPSAFLAGLRHKGLPSADTLVERDPDVAGQLLTQSKQLALILDATRARLDAPARTALQFADLLPPDTVPWPWLRALTVARHPEVAAHAPDEPDLWLETRRRLTGLRLLTPGDHPELARIHRLVAAHVKTLNDANAFQTFTGELIAHAKTRCLYLHDEGWIDEEKRWELSPLVACAEWWMNRSVKDGAFISHEIATVFMRLGDEPTAERLLAAAEAKVKESSLLGELDPNYAALLNNEAGLLEAQGEHEKAMSMRARALSLYRLNFGDFHPFVATACANLAKSYGQCGRLDDAKELLAQAVAIDESTYGQDHPEVATDLTTLAVVFQHCGELDAAESTMHRVIRIYRKHLPPNHPLLAVGLNNLGGLFLQTGRPTEAEPLLREAVEINRACLGSEHPDLATRLNSFALVLRACGRLQDAYGAAQEALQILVAHSKKTGRPHPNIQAAVNTLGGIALEAGLPEPIVRGVINGLLRPLRE